MQESKDPGTPNLLREGSGVDLDALEAVAKAATEGPWEAVLGEVPYEEFGGELTWTVDTRGGGLCTLDGASKKLDALYIATFDPPTVLRLLSERRGLLEALEPFATAARGINPDLPDGTVVALRIGTHTVYHVALGSLKSARAVVAKAEGRS